MMGLGEIISNEICIFCITYQNSDCIFPQASVFDRPTLVLTEVGKFETGTSNTDIHIKGDDSF